MLGSDSPTQRILAPGSFSGLHNEIGALGKGYLTATAQRHQPLCGNEEGWGPLSPFRYDFTPCFMDVWVSSVAVYGILFGAAAIWYLGRKREQDVKRDLHFWTKQVCWILIWARASIPEAAVGGLGSHQLDRAPRIGLHEYGASC